MYGVISGTMLQGYFRILLIIETPFKQEEEYLLLILSDQGVR